MKVGKRCKMSKNKVSKLLDVAKRMPPLYHTLPGEEFDVSKSEVIQWLIRQPDILSYISNRVRGDSKLIVYDRETGKWQGVDYNGN